MVFWFPVPDSGLYGSDLGFGFCGRFCGLLNFGVGFIMVFG